MMNDMLKVLFQLPALMAAVGLTFLVLRLYVGGKLNQD
jgi:hypothetical protein